MSLFDSKNSLKYYLSSTIWFKFFTETAILKRFIIVKPTNVFRNLFTVRCKHAKCSTEYLNRDIANYFIYSSSMIYYTMKIFLFFFNQLFKCKSEVVKKWKISFDGTKLDVRPCVWQTSILSNFHSNVNKSLNRWDMTPFFSSIKFCTRCTCSLFFLHEKSFCFRRGSFIPYTSTSVANQ